jgi:carbon monoxide dehydrogenase subunit G
VKTRIDAPLQRVWDTVMDPQRLEEWVTIHRSLQDVSPGSLRKGSTMDQVMHIRGFSFHVYWTLVELKPPTHAEWSGKGPAHSHAKIRYELTGDDHATEFEYFNDFTPPGGRLGTVASRLIVGAASEREAHNSLQRLKNLLESS